MGVELIEGQMCCIACHVLKSDKTGGLPENNGISNYETNDQEMLRKERKKNDRRRREKKKKKTGKS
jgi:hypothetical protein